MRNLKNLLFPIALAFAATSLVGMTLTGCEQKAEEEEEKKEEGEGEGEAEAEGEAAEGEDEAAEGEGEAAEGEGETAEAEGEGEAAEGGEPMAVDTSGLGENCAKYAEEVAAVCGDAPDAAKTTCDSWIQAIESYKTAGDAAEPGCQAALGSAEQVAAGWAAAGDAAAAAEAAGEAAEAAGEAAEEAGEAAEGETAE